MPTIYGAGLPTSVKLKAQGPWRKWESQLFEELLARWQSLQVPVEFCWVGPFCSAEMQLPQKQELGLTEQTPCGWLWFGLEGQERVKFLGVCSCEESAGAS